MHINRKKLYEILMETLNLYACRVAVPGKRWKDLLNYELVGFLIKEIIFNDPTQGCEMRGKKEDWNGNAHHAFAYMAGHVTFLSRIPDAF